MSNPSGTARHWDEAYRHGDTTRSWFQQQALPSLRMIDATDTQLGDSIIDVGGGASTFVDALLERGHQDVTVLDISVEGMTTAQRRLGTRASHVQWVVADLRTWTPERTWRVWHDRAVLHFFTTQPDQQSYLHALEAATEPGSLAILATFAPDGPPLCSGLAVSRYDAAQLGQLLGDRWRSLAHTREDHTTPGDNTQPFTWAVFRRET